MSLRLVVAERLDDLVQVAADVLRAAPADPFARELVAVPSDGIRTWLVQSLARALGDAPPGLGGGIVANVEVVYPGVLVRRALDLPDQADPWSIGSLTWTIHALARSHGDELGLAADVLRARAVADLFDRYSLHRAPMIHAWERGHDLGIDGQQLPAAARWQPRLWRMLVEQLGVPSPVAMAASAVERLRAAGPVGELPERMIVFGVAGLPAPHLEVLSAVARSHDVHVLAPVPSLAWWRRLHPAAAALEATALLRAHDPTVTVVHHPLGRSWGRSPREASLGVLAAAVRAGAAVEEVAPVDAPSSTGDLLGRLQHVLRADLEPPPPGEVDDQARPALASGDRSIQWHRCHGLARQVEVLRDALLHLLDERRADGSPRWEPRDVLVVCPDVAAVAPLVDAAFAGDGPAGSLPALPVRVADRSLRRDIPVFDAVLGVIELLDGRFRVSDLLGLAAVEPIAARFGFTPDSLGRIAHWLEATHVRWGFDEHRRQTFGVPASFTANTWRAGLDQLLLGAALADDGPRIGPGGVVPYGDLEGDDVTLLGGLSDFVETLGRAVEQLAGTHDVVGWCDLLAATAHDLCALDDVDSWQWERLERELATLRDEAIAAGESASVPVDSRGLATLVSAHLAGRPGRPRFGSGAITVSSLTAQRGVPYPIVCIVGLDGDLGAGATLAADDLIAQQPCVGDRDPRSELRAQLLDTVLAARDRLVLCSTGRHLATNADVPPATVLTELADVIDATMGPPADGAGAGAARASEAIAVDHPRQAWSEPNFVPAALGVAGPWSFDAGARAAAERRRLQLAPAPVLDHPLEAAQRSEVPLAQLHAVLRSPVRTFLADRVGIGLHDPPEQRDDLVPLTVDGRSAWALADEVLEARRSVSGDEADGAAAARLAVLRAAGAVPPLRYGERTIGSAAMRAAAVDLELVRVLRALGAPARAGHVPIEATVEGGITVLGQIEGVHGDVLVDATVSELSPKRRLAVWLSLAAVTACHPGRSWSAVLIGTKPVIRSGETVHVSVTELLRWRDPQAAAEVLELVVDLHGRALRDVVPFFPATSHALHTSSLAAAAAAWGIGDFQRGEGRDPWVTLVYGLVAFDEMLRIEPRPDELSPEWGSGGRLARWAQRIWGAVEQTVEVGDVPAEPQAGSGDERTAGGDD